MNQKIYPLSAVHSKFVRDRGNRGAFILSSAFIFREKVLCSSHWKDHGVPLTAGTAPNTPSPLPNRLLTAWSQHPTPLPPPPPPYWESRGFSLSPPQIPPQGDVKDEAGCYVLAPKRQPYTSPVDPPLAHFPPFPRRGPCWSPLFPNH